MTEVRIASRRCGNVDPASIDAFLADDGYEGLRRAVELGRDGTVELIERSGLRGRGGGGYPTGSKWRLASIAADRTRFIICNADEGDPGAFMDRRLIEGDPFAILEGMTIAGFAIGARRGFVYVRHEYPLARRRLERAIEKARHSGWLGEDIGGLGLSFDIEVRRGAGAFVCGEETALIASMEGKLGLPVLRPPYPVESGLWGHPTVINNVETFATVPWIARHGVDAFRSTGTPDAPGTKVFCLAGDVRNPGMVEVPLGTPLRTVVEELGGGSEKRIKAVQIGGPSGGCLPASMLDVPLDYASMIEAGAMLGSGGLVVMDESTCMVDVARYFVDFMSRESCGKCTACREGTAHLARLLDRICEGDGQLEDLDLLESLSRHVRGGSICGLGQSAPNPLESTLRHFREEYVAHVKERRCPVGQCPALTRYVVDTADCDGCEMCVRACPAAAIQLQAHMIPVQIDDDRCVRCKACFEVCPFEAVRVEA